VSSAAAATGSAGTSPAEPAPVKAVAVRHYGRWVAAVIVLVCFAGLLWSLAKNPNLEWPVIREYLFKPLTLKGVAVTIQLTIFAMLIGIVGGILLAVMRQSKNPVLSGVAWVYIWFFRGTPVLVQIIFWGYLGAFYHDTLIGIPFTHITFFSAPTSDVINGFTASLLALGLNEAAYAAEIVRAGILSVDNGQTEAAHSLGMSPTLTMRRIVLPQAMRVITPPMGNETISMLKTSALVSVISGKDLLTRLQDVYSQTFQNIPLLVVASLWYIALTTVLSVFQSRLERRYGRGVGFQQPGTVARMIGLRNPGRGAL